MPRTKSKAIFDAGIQIPAGAATGYVLRSSDSAGNAGWQAAAVVYYEQPADPGAVGAGSIWVDTDAIMTPSPPIIPIGTVLPTAIPNTGPASAPGGFLFCDGSAVSRTTYANLYAALGGASSPYGQGDGSTTFGLPDLTGRTLLGVGNSGEAGGTVHTLGQKTGEEKHTLSAAETGVPAHGHADTIAATAHAHDIHTSGNLVVLQSGLGYDGHMQKGSGTSIGNTQDATPGITGGVTNHAGTAATSHNNLPPYLGLNFIVKY